MTVGYLIGSHVCYQSKALPMLLASLRTDQMAGIEPERIVVAVNGAGKPHVQTVDGVRMRYQVGEMACPLAALLNENFGCDYWFFLNVTSRAGPRFRELVEAGYDPEADATLAGALLNNGPSGGKHGRAINDMCMYRLAYLQSVRDKIESVKDAPISEHIDDLEGWFYAHAPKQAQYPDLGYELNQVKSDVYGTGTMRATEYFPAVDLIRWKRNFGQLPATHHGAFL